MAEPIGKISGQTRVLDQAFEIAPVVQLKQTMSLVVLPCADWPLKAAQFAGPDLWYRATMAKAAICNCEFGDTVTHLVTEGGSLG